MVGIECQIRMKSALLSEYDDSSVTSWAIGLKDEEKEGMWKWYLTGADDGRNWEH